LSTLRKREIAVLKDLAPDLAACRVDAQMIEQVLVNLITNACQAMEGAEGPKLLEIASAVQDGRIVLRVSELGAGSSPFPPGEVFDPFSPRGRRGPGSDSASATGSSPTTAGRCASTRAGGGGRSSGSISPPQGKGFRHDPVLPLHRRR